ncbi:glycosyltransferase family 2 protein [Rathayibacter sp. VKM Ac-2630]|uniref:glycosyltransferase family 2 protein n=1 Tax=Rathayibacter sp. VKM Ac-2630 TaxID=1938617 RepID=UPI0009CCB9C2|nr:glycosyltransferase family 2 protein [Rathayibacter sp. VKM Ac-2630]OOB90368.1 hypothetical protein B0T42_12285 [Rathayibacter sp. VKM Ac-2630]
MGIARSISVIVVTYNSAEHIVPCIGPLVDIPDFEVIVVDNLSSDNSTSIARGLTNVVVIANSENVGFAKAVNQAATRATGDVIILLNPDCRVAAADLRALADQVRNNSEIGVVAPTITHPDGRLEVRSAGYEPNLAHMTVHALGLGRRRIAGHLFRGFNLYAAGETAPMTRVDWVSGACFAIRTDLWWTIGGLSERWFMYAEDIDLCRRVREGGLLVVQDSTTLATHEVGASSEVATGPVFTMWIESLADYYREVYNPSATKFWAWRLIVASGLGLRALRFAVLGRKDRVRAAIWLRESEKFRAYARAVLAPRFSAE